MMSATGTPEDGRAVTIIGTGAQAKYVLETCHQSGRPVLGVISWQTNEESQEFQRWRHWCDAYNVALWPWREDLGSDAGAEAVIVCTSDPDVKRYWLEEAERRGLLPTSSVHPAAVVASSAELGRGSIVNANAVIQPFATLGRGAMVHANASIDHDARVGDYVMLGPGARLAGWVTVGDAATLFTSASVIPMRRVGARATVAAGAVVTQDVPDDALAVGVPAHSRRKPEASRGEMPSWDTAS